MYDRVIDIAFAPPTRELPKPSTCRTHVVKNRLVQHCGPGPCGCPGSLLQGRRATDRGAFSHAHIRHQAARKGQHHPRRSVLPLRLDHQPKTRCRQTFGCPNRSPIRLSHARCRHALQPSNRTERPGRTKESCRGDRLNPRLTPRPPPLRHPVSMVGTPSIRVLRHALGYSTHAPEAEKGSRRRHPVQPLDRLFCRSASMPRSILSSRPGGALVALTFSMPHGQPTSNLERFLPATSTRCTATPPPDPRVCG